MINIDLKNKNKDLLVTAKEYVKGEKGDPGYTPIKGVDYFDGYTPVKGVDYFDGKDGYTPVKGVDYVDGKDGKDGKDYVLTEADKQEIATLAAVPDVSAFQTAEQVEAAITEALGKIGVAEEGSY